MTKNLPLHEQNLPAYYQEDEINLVDLWLVLAKRRVVLVSGALLCVLAGLLYATLTPRSYQYSTSIEIGTRFSGGKLEIIESPQTLLAKIKESYIPLTRQEYFSEYHELGGIPKIEVHVPKGSQIIVLTSKGPESMAEIHMTMQQSVVNMVKKDHNRIADVLRKEAEIVKNKSVAQMDELKDAAELLKADKKRLNDTAALLAKQAVEVKQDLQRTEANRQKAVYEATSEAKAMTLLMLDSQIQQYRERLAQIDERLQIKTAALQDQLAKSLADNRRAQANQQDAVIKLKMQLANFQETRALLPPMRSPESVGPGRSLIIVLSLVLGLMLGVFAAFFVEFLSKVRAQTSQAPGNTG